MVHVHVLLDKGDLDRSRVRVEVNPHLPEMGAQAEVILPEGTLVCRPPAALSNALRSWADQIDEQAAALEREAVTP